MAAAGVGVYGPGESPGTHDEALEAVKLAFEVGGGDVNDANRDGETALLGAVYRGGAVPVIQFLADKGARLDVANKKQWTPLLAAEGVVYASSGIRRYPEAAALIRRLMRERGLPIPEIERDGGAVPIIKATAASDATPNQLGRRLHRAAGAAAVSRCISARVPPATSTRCRATPCRRRCRAAHFWRGSPGRAHMRWCRTCVRSMPQNAPDSLGDRAYVDLVAYLLKANGGRPGALELSLDVAELERITISDRPRSP